MRKSFQLARNAFGQLVLTLPNGEESIGVAPVRAFPVSAPDEGIALVGPDGQEKIWIERLDALPDSLRRALVEALEQREFMPRIERLVAVSGFATPSTWTVDTDRGRTTLILKGEEFIRRLGPEGLLIEDSQGIHFRVARLAELDKNSRRLLDRFL